MTDMFGVVGLNIGMVSWFLAMLIIDRLGFVEEGWGPALSVGIAAVIAIPICWAKF